MKRITDWVEDTIKSSHPIPFIAQVSHSSLKPQLRQNYLSAFSTPVNFCGPAWEPPAINKSDLS